MNQEIIDIDKAKGKHPGMLIGGDDEVNLGTLKEAMPKMMEDDDSSEEDDSDDDDEPLIIQLMESMFTRKKTVQESEQMISQISIQDIKNEFKRIALREKCRLAEDERQKLYEQRMIECEKLNQLIKQENEEISLSEIDKPDSMTRENPFFMALRAQKMEREKYKQLLQLAIMSGLQETNPTTEDRPLQQIEGPPEDGANDIFKHTFVDIMEEENSNKQQQ